MGIANRARELQPEIRVIYTPLEHLLRELSAAKDVESAYREAEILLVDDLQFIGHHSESHQILFHLLDHLLLAGRQVALACDRPPLELGELDDRLLSRFSGGLVVDIGRPVLETRRTILELRVAAVGASVRTEVIDAIARSAIENVRQLKGALNRVLAVQKAEGREIGPHEVDRLLADVVGDRDMPWVAEAGGRSADEFEDFLSDVSSAVEYALGTPEWREALARTIMKWEGEGYLTARIERCLEEDEAVDAEEAIRAFERDIAGLKVIEEELKRLGRDVPKELSLRDPDDIDELRAYLEKVRRSDLSVDDYFFDTEKVVWDWPSLEDRLIESWGDGDQG